MNRNKIIAETNFLEQLCYSIYVRRVEFSALHWKTIKLRLQSIRDEARKEDDEKPARPQIEETKV